MARREPVGSIRRPSDYGSGDEDGSEFIRCVDGRQPKIHEVWVFGEDGVTPEVRPTARVDVSALLVNIFLTLTLIQIGVGSLCLAVIILMEASSVPSFLKYSGSIC